VGAPVPSHVQEHVTLQHRKIVSVTLTKQAGIGVWKSLVGGGVLGATACSWLRVLMLINPERESKASK
jgi:hypothetical protein